MSHNISIESTPKRDNSLSIIRICAMLMVVFYHCICPYTRAWKDMTGNYCEAWDFVARWLNQIDMPAFVYVSGYLFAYLFSTGRYDINDKSTIIRKKTIRLMTPYIIIGGGVTVCISAHCAKDLFTGISHLWFLLMLMTVFTIATMSIRLWSNLNLKQALALLSALYFLNITAHYFHLHTHCRLFAIDRAIDFLPSFYLGIMVFKYSLLKRVKHPAINCILLVAVYTAAAYISPKGIPIISRICTYSLNAISLALIVSTHRIISQKQIRNAMLQSLDRCSMGIYIIHHLIIHEWFVRDNNLLQWINANPLTAPFLMFAFVLPISWGLSHVVLKSRLRFILG